MVLDSISLNMVMVNLNNPLIQWKDVVIQLYKTNLDQVSINHYLNSKKRTDHHSVKILEFDNKMLEYRVLAPMIIKTLSLNMEVKMNPNMDLDQEFN